MKTGPRKRNRRKTTDIQLALKFHWRPQQARKERLESHTNRLHNGSTRLLTYRSVSDQTGNTWSEKQEHEGSYLELDSPKSPLHVLYDPQILFHCSNFQDQMDTPISTYRNHQQGYGEIQFIPPSDGGTGVGPHSTRQGRASNCTHPLIDCNPFEVSFPWLAKWDKQAHWHKYNPRGSTRNQHQY